MSINANVENLKKWVNLQINKVTNLDVAGDKKGSALQTAKAHKEGYIEALTAVREMLQQIK